MSQNETTAWQPIETAPQDQDADPILVAHFREHDRLPVYAVMASWGSAMPGYTHCASYSGWFIHCLPTEDPPRRRGVNVVADEILPRSEMPPTHWRSM